MKVREYNKKLNLNPKTQVCQGWLGELIKGCSNIGLCFYFRVRWIELEVKIVDDVIKRFPEIRICVREVKDVVISEADSRLEDFKEQVFDDVRSKFTLEGLKDESVFRVYRDFFWRNRTDPTKVRPAAEALIRRVLNGRPLPCVNTVVDTYNLASMTTCIALAAFDIDRLNGQLIIRLADNGESFLGIQDRGYN